MPGGIDYSKWDNLDEYSSSDDGEQNDSSDNVRVTQLDAPSQVTFGGEDASTPTIMPSSSCKAPAIESANGIGTAEVTNTKSTLLSDHNETDPYYDWQEKGGMVSITSSSNHNRRLYWSQGRYSVLLRLELFQEEKIKSVQVNGSVSYRDRFCAVGSSRPTIQVHSTSAAAAKSEELKLLLEGELPHAVHFSEDEDEIEWSVERSNRDERFLTITLFKASPIQDVSVWWQRPLMAFDEIEIETKSDSGPQSFQQAWEEAHKIFQQRRQPSS
ncbi:unnamed protein product [Cylindrotheca closterium]|uniref:CS domain-containing protein n=1 Tax=Cylindrotheca closterium TaxID=2856 RepID=A0AAD2GCM6_9STRA|nr:unnamed protein product [Cylindrotheca closterium]